MIYRCIARGAVMSALTSRNVIARAQSRFSHNESLRRTTQEIIVEQQQEIGAMPVALSASFERVANEPSPSFIKA
jgi:uncharacterized protein (DUF305 family)